MIYDHCIDNPPKNWWKQANWFDDVAELEKKYGKENVRVGGWNGKRCDRLGRPIIEIIDNPA